MLQGTDNSTVPALEFSSSPFPQRTNTLIITGLPKPFFHPPVTDALRTCFAVYGPVHSWSVLKSFSRMIVVYHEEEDAELAKKAYDDCEITASDNWFV
jgi:calcipressin-2